VVFLRRRAADRRSEREPANAAGFDGFFDRFECGAPHCCAETVRARMVLSLRATSGIVRSDKTSRGAKAQPRRRYACPSKRSKSS
jgi:hypothetical protein